MGDSATNTVYDLGKRTLNFAQSVKLYVLALPKNVANIEYGKQLIRSSGSVGANYIEANDSLGKKDFLFRIKISRKEAKESQYWLELTDCDSSNVSMKNDLINESIELIKILSAILLKVK